MSIVQALVGAIVSSGSGGGGPPNAYANYGVTPTEGSSTDVTVFVENWTGNRVYWTVVGKGSPAADPNTDMTGTLSGYWDPGSGTLSSLVTTITFAGSDGTEGIEYWGVDLGSSPGASDYYSGSYWPIYEPVNYTPWTIEWWHKSNPTQPSQFPRVFGIATYPNQEIGFSIEGTYYAWVNGSGISTGVPVVHNVWQHWVMVSGETTLSVYKDGVRVTSVPRGNYGLIDNVINPLYIGVDSNPADGFKGLITNFRVVKGQAMYDPSQTTITVPTAPLWGNVSTELLLKAADAVSVYTDSSRRGRTAAGIGTNAFSSDTPFTAPAPAGPYTTNEGISAFNPEQGTLYVLKSTNPNVINVQPGWTVTATGYTGTVTAVTDIPGLYYVVYVELISGDLAAGIATFTQYQTGGSIEMYAGGSYGMIMYDAGTEWAFDLPSVVRLTSGTALGFDGSSNRHVVVEGTQADWNLGDNWTIEWWQKIPAGASGFMSVLCQDANVPTYSGIDVFVNNGNIQMFNGNRQMSESTAPRDKWNHIALQNYGTTVKGYINGVEQPFNGTHPGTISPSSPLNVVIGSRTADGGVNFYGQYFNGQIANIRISNIARYSTAFIPPTRVDTSDINTVLALDGSLGSGGMLVDETSRHTLTNNAATTVTIV